MESRKQFEQWVSDWYKEHGSFPSNYDGWQAGRASMRDEAVDACLCQFNAGNNYAGTECANAIKDIQP